MQLLFSLSRGCSFNSNMHSFHFIHSYYAFARVQLFFFHLMEIVFWDVKLLSNRGVRLVGLVVVIFSLLSANETVRMRKSKREKKRKGERKREGESNTEKCGVERYKAKEMGTQRYPRKHTFFCSNWHSYRPFLHEKKTTNV